MNMMEEQESTDSEAIAGTYRMSQAENMAKINMSFFGGLCIPDVCNVPFPPVFISIWFMLKSALMKKKDFSKFAIGLPRGHGKTTVIKLLIVFIVLFTSRKFILIVGASATLAENILSDVADILDSDNIVKIFGNWRDFQEVDRAGQKRGRFRGRNIILASMGTGGSLRGINIKNARPDVIICDDMQTKEEAESDVVSKKLLQWFVGTLMKTKAPDGCTYLYVGNMYRDIKIGGSQSSLYTCILRNLQNNRTWVSWIVGAILADGTALWEEVQSLEQLMEDLENDISMGCPDVFYSEVLNDPKCGTGEHFDLSKMPEFTVDPEIDMETGRFIIIDPSLGKKKSDAQVVGEVSVYEGVPVLEHIHICQTTAPKLVDFVLELANKKGIPLICAESVAYQGTLLHWFDKECRDKGYSGIVFAPVTPGGRSKNSRIINSFKGVMSGEIVIHPRCLAAWLSQTQTFDPLSTKNSDDILDVTAYIEDVMIHHTNEMILPDILSLEYSVSEELPAESCLG